MNRPLNRYDRLGWLCQNPSSDFSRSGRRRNGTVLGVRAAHHHVVAAAGADMAAVQHELFRRQPDLAGFLVKFLGRAAPVPPSCAPGGRSPRSRRDRG